MILTGWVEAMGMSLWIWGCQNQAKKGRNSYFQITISFQVYGAWSRHKCLPQGTCSLSFTIKAVNSQKRSSPPEGKKLFLIPSWAPWPEVRQCMWNLSWQNDYFDLVILFYVKMYFRFMIMFVLHVFIRCVSVAEIDIWEIWNLMSCSFTCIQYQFSSVDNSKN